MEFIVNHFFINDLKSIHLKIDSKEKQLSKPYDLRKPKTNSKTKKS